MEIDIVHRIYDFIRDFLPFNILPEEALLKIAKNATVKYLPPGSILFSAGDQPQNIFYIVNAGVVHLKRSDGQLIDICEEGNVFGIRPLMAQSNYLLTAKCQKETILYCINNDNFLQYIETYPKVAMYLTTSFAKGAGSSYINQNERIIINQNNNNQPAIYSELFIIDGKKDVIFYLANDTIFEVAKKMAKNSIGSVVICDNNQLPIGIVTDKDLRIKVVGGEIGKERNITEIMSSPVICVQPGLSIAELNIQMIKNNINHLAVTRDGTTNSKLLGIISEHDLVVQQADNPSILIKEIRKSTSASQLKMIRDKVESLIKKYLKQDISISFISQIVTEINDEIVHKAIKMAISKIGEDIYRDINFCWLAIGSAGRGEQILRTDQDSAIIYEQNSAIPELKIKCLRLAKEVSDILNEVGYIYCPANMMASNPEYTLSLEEWKNTFNKWIYEPGENEILMCSIFFDMRPVYGHFKLAEELIDKIHVLLQSQEIFLHFMANNVLNNPPPFSFFRNLILEKSGENKDCFDIKLRAMLPLLDAARILYLDKKKPFASNTVKRFISLADDEPNNAELYNMAADAYQILMHFRVTQGIKSGNNGRYILPEKLSKMERLQLRNALQPIDEIQKLIRIRYVPGNL
ncbi:MAG: DUF294 nucleotidyltransferase-like domain-containing protein [Saprospiraceae bacterium]